MGQSSIGADSKGTSGEDVRARRRDSIEQGRDAANAPTTTGDLFDDARRACTAEGPVASNADTPLAPHQPALSLDTSKIANPRSREHVEDVVSRLDQSFDTMLAKVVPDGVFIALTEFVGQEADGASIVRSLHDAGLLAIDETNPARRVCTERIEGADMTGVVLRASALHGYAEWLACWQADGQSDADAT